MQYVRCLRKTGKQTESHFPTGGGAVTASTPTCTTVQTQKKIFTRRRPSGNRVPNRVKLEVSCDSYIVYAYKCLPLLSQIINHYPSEMVTQLMWMSVTPLAQSHAECGIPLAGRLEYFLQNWHVITQDRWVLEAVQGYRVPFTGVPRQPRPPGQIVLLQEGDSLMGDEIQGMLEKGAISRTSPRGRGFLSNVFLVPKQAEVRDP